MLNFKQSGQAANAVWLKVAATRCKELDSGAHYAYIHKRREIEITPSFAFRLE
jgi:hypothetical protein